MFGDLSANSFQAISLAMSYSQPRPQASSRYPSEWRRLETERDVIWEITEDDWERG